VISVTDVNNHKPVFPECALYGERAVIAEGRHVNQTRVIHGKFTLVKATVR